MMIRPARVTAGIVVAALATASCVHQSIEARSATYAPTTRQKMGQVINQPLHDLNLSSTDIPPLLVQVSLAPYAPPARPDCQGLKAEIDAISGILGPDIQPMAVDKKGNLLDYDNVETAAWGTARGAADGWIPFHGVLRELSGAAAHDRMVERAVLAGFVRRAYLRGLSASRCL